MALAPIAAQLVTKLPFLAPVGLALSTAIVFQGNGPAVLGALLQSDSNDPSTKLQGLKTLQLLVNALLTYPAVVESAAQNQIEPAKLQAQTSAAVVELKSAAFSTASLPAFNTAAQAQGFQDLVLDEYKAGNLTEIDWLNVFAWTESEKKRLVTGLSSAAAKANPALAETYSSLPTFPTLDAADSFITQAKDLYNQGDLTPDGLSRLATWYSLELRRIKVLPLDAVLIESAVKWGFIAPAAPAAAAPAPAAPAAAAPAPAAIPAAPAAIPAAGAPITVNVTPQVNVPGFATLATNVLTLGGPLNQLAAAGAAMGLSLQAMQQQLASVSIALSKPFPTQFDFPNLQDVLKPVAGALTGAGAGTLAGSIALALANNAGPRAHNAQQARYECQSGFMGGLQNVMTKLGPQLLVSGGIFFNSPLRNSAEEILNRVISAQINVGQYAAPASEQNALDNATKRLVQALGFGLEAQMLSYSAEALTPLKQMGFNQLAGFLGELSGFERIGQGLMGTIEDASLYSPLRWAANRRFRPVIPGIGTLEGMFAKYAITRAEAADYLERNGYDDTFISRMPSYLYRDPRLGELVRVFQYSEPGAGILSDDDKLTLKIAGIKEEDPDVYYKLKLARAGYEPIDIDAFVRPLRMGLVRREQTAVYEQITRLYREGFIDRERARVLIDKAREPDTVTNFRLAGLDLQREYEQKEDIRQMVLAALGRRLLTTAEARAALLSAGMDPARADVHVLRARMGLVPRSVGVVVAETLPPVEVQDGAP